jgi:hypothetical protein
MKDPKRKLLFLTFLVASRLSLEIILLPRHYLKLIRQVLDFIHDVIFTLKLIKHHIT